MSAWVNKGLLVITQLPEDVLDHKHIQCQDAAWDAGQRVAGKKLSSCFTYCKRWKQFMPDVTIYPFQRCLDCLPLCNQIPAAPQLQFWLYEFLILWNVLKGLTASQTLTCLFWMALPTFEMKDNYPSYNKIPHFLFLFDGSQCPTLPVTYWHPVGIRYQLGRTHSKCAG